LLRDLAPTRAKHRALLFLTGTYGPAIRTAGAINWPLNLQEYRLQEAGPEEIPSTGIEHKDKKMFAVFKTGGKQYRVAADDKLQIDKIKGEPGEIVAFGEVLLIGGDSVQSGAPTVEGASIAAEVIEQGRGPKIIAFKKRRRKNSRRKRGHRQEFTLIRITEILTEGRKPSEITPQPQRAKKPAPKEADETTEAAETAETADRKTTAKKKPRHSARAHKKPPAAKKKPQARAKRSKK
jgi:large subunit ribosomal protein L21